MGERSQGIARQKKTGSLSICSSCGCSKDEHSPAKSIFGKHCRLCFICLSNNHQASQCPEPVVTCSHCGTETSLPHICYVKYVEEAGDYIKNVKAFCTICGDIEREDCCKNIIDDAVN